MLYLLQTLLALLALEGCVCGKAIMRILGTGGKEAGSRFPWVVRLVQHDGEMCAEGGDGGGYGLICSGSLISQSWLLAAGHCADATHVQLNTQQTARGAAENEDPRKVLFRKILKIHVHPGYQYQDASGPQGGRGRLENDIALFKTEEINMKEYGKIDSRDFRGLFGREVYFIGYGLTKYLDSYTKQTEIDTELINGPLKYGTGLLGDCSTAKYQGSLKKQDLHFNFCVMRKCSDFSLISNGDTGGPIVVDDKIVGINTVMIEDRKTEPSEDLMSVVATPISPYIDWIQNLAKKSSTEFYKL